MNDLYFKILFVLLPIGNSLPHHHYQESTRKFMHTKNYKIKDSLTIDHWQYIMYLPNKPSVGNCFWNTLTLMSNHTKEYLTSWANHFIDCNYIYFK